jgi:tetratricopeptide (TPR) repeat protein
MGVLTRTHQASPPEGRRLPPMTTPLQAARRACGWSQVRAVSELLRLARWKGVHVASAASLKTQLSRWENGQVTPDDHYQALLCEIYKSIPAQLGFGIQEPPDNTTIPSRDEFAQFSAKALAAVEHSRQAMTGMLSVTRKPDIEYLEEGVLGHARDSIQTEPGDMLRRLVVDYDEVRILISKPQDLRQLRDLYRISARLGALIADELMVLGRPAYAESWHKVARQTADETGDDALRALVRTLAAILPLYYGDATETVRLTAEARAILPGPQDMAYALAPILASLAYAQLGDQQSARSALKTARESFEALDSRHQADSVFGFSERRLNFYESRVLSQLGDISSAIDAQEQALTLYPREVVGDRTLIELDMASCIIRDKNVTGGLQMASNVLINLPAAHRSDIFLRYAWNVASVVPTRFRSDPNVAEYRELLRSLDR